jgi:hypothetical protein
MKKTLILLLLVGTVWACGTTKTVKTSKKIIKGEWTLNRITFSTYGTFKVTFFNDVSKKCIEGSQWKFIPNNNSGTYSIDNRDCENGLRDFVFTIQEVDHETGLYDFLLKPTNAKHKSDTNQGFRLKLSMLNEASMQWQQNASIDGKNIIIDMNFSKN